MTYNITDLAKEQIIEAYIYGHQQFGRDQAERYLASLQDCFSLLSDNPRLARIREEYERPLRIHHHRKHYIVYVILEDTEEISILSVLQEESALARHLRSLRE